jgi:hypothetical protein
MFHSLPQIIFDHDDFIDGFDEADLIHYARFTMQFKISI